MVRKVFRYSPGSTEGSNTNKDIELNQRPSEIISLHEFVKDRAGF